MPGSPTVDGTSRARSSSLLAELLNNNKQYAAAFDKPLAMGVNKKVGGGWDAAPAVAQACGHCPPEG
jgi:hypothetical protein